MYIYILGAAVERHADRRRLEDAHLKFAVITGFPPCSDINSVLQSFTSKYYTIFTAKYAGKPG